MPLIKVQSSVAAPDPEAVTSLLKELSSSLARHLGKPEAYVMTLFEPAIAMTFAGSAKPTCYIEIKSIGTMGSDKTLAMSRDFCQKIEKTLGVPSDRTYIEFADAKGAMWGWNGATFG